MSRYDSLSWWVKSHGVTDARAACKVSNKLNFIKIEAVQAKLWAILENSEKEKKVEDDA